MTRQIYPTLFISSVLGLTLGACSSFETNDDPSYRSARTITALEVPPDLSAPRGVENQIPEFALAEASANDLDEFARFNQLMETEEYAEFQQWKADRSQAEALDFKAFVAAKNTVREAEGGEAAGVSLNRLTSEAREIEVETNRESTWQILGAALNNSDIKVLKESPEKWEYQVEIPQLGGESFFSRGGKGLVFSLDETFGTTIIRLLDKRGNQPISPIAANVMEGLVDQVRFEKVRMEINQSIIPSEALAGSLSPNESGDLDLLLDVQGETLWRQIDFVADQVGFTILDRIPEQGKFVIRFISSDVENEETSMGSKLAFWRKNKDGGDEDQTYTIQILPGKSGESISRIRVTDSNGLPTDSGAEILELLRSHL